MSSSVSPSELRDGKNQPESTMPNPFAVRVTSDSALSPSSDLEDAAARIQQACEQALSDAYESRKYRPRVGFLTLTNFCIITVLLTLCEFAFILYGAAIGHVIALGVGELVLYTLVGIGAMIDLHHYRKTALHSPIADRLGFLANEVDLLESLKSGMQSEITQLKQTHREVEHEEKATRYSLSQLELTLAALHESVDELESIETVKMDTITRQNRELEQAQAEAIVIKERAEQLRLEVQSLNAARDESIRLKESAHSELIRIQTELDLNRIQQETIALKLGGLNEKIDSASIKLEQQESEFAQKLDELAKANATIEEQRQLQLEIDSQVAMLDSLKRAEASLTAKLEDAEAGQKVEELERCREQLRQDVAKLEQTVLQLEAERQNLSEQTASLGSSRESMERELQTLRDATECTRTALAVLVKTQEELTQVVCNLREEVERREQDKTGLSNQLEDARQNLAEIQEDVDQAIIALANAERRQEQVQARTDSLNELVELRSQDVLNAKQELIALRAELREGEGSLKQLETAKAQTSDLNANLELARNELRSTQTQVEELTVTLNDLLASRSSVEEELNARQLALTELEWQCQSQGEQWELVKRETSIASQENERVRELGEYELGDLRRLVNEVVLDYQMTERELAENREQLAMELADQQRERSLAEKQMAVARRELESLTQNSVLKTREIDALEICRQQLQKEVDESQTRIDKAELELAALVDKQSGQQRLHDEWLASNTRLAELVTAQKSEHERRSIELATLQSDHSRASQELRAKQSEIANATHELQMKRDELAVLNRETERAKLLTQECHEFELKIATQRHTIEQLRTDEREILGRLEKLKRDSDERQATSNRLEAKIHELQSSVATHSSTLREEQLALEELFNRQKIEQQKLASITTATVDAQNHLTKAESTANAWVIRVKESEARLRALEAEISDAQQVGQQWDTYIAKLRNESDLLVKNNLENEQSLNHILMMKQNAMNEMKRVEAALQKNQNELYQLEYKLNEARDRAAALSSEINDLTLQRNRCGKELDEKENRFADVSRKLDQLELTLRSQKEASAIEAKRLQERESAREAVEAELVKLMGKRDSTENQLASIAAQSSRAKEELADLNTQLEIVRRELQNADATREVLEALQREQAEAERNASALRFKIEEANAVYERLRVEADQESLRVKSLENQSFALKTQIESDTSIKAQLEEQQKTLQKQCDEAERELAEHRQHMLAAQTTLQMTEGKLDDTARGLDELQERCIELESTRRDLETTNDAIKQTTIDTESSLQHVQQQLADEQGKLLAHQKLTESYARETSERESQLQGLRVTITAIEVQKASLQNELTEFERLHLAAVERLQQLQIKLRVGLVQEQNLERQFKEIHDQHEALQAQLTQGHALRDSLQHELETESRVIAKLRSEREALSQANSRVLEAQKPTIAVESTEPKSLPRRDSTNLDQVVSEVVVRVDSSRTDIPKPAPASAEVDAWDQMLSDLRESKSDLDKARVTQTQRGLPTR
jgi:chromosome segregation ATPase